MKNRDATAPPSERAKYHSSDNTIHWNRLYVSNCLF